MINESVLNNLSKEQIESMVNNPGENHGGSLGEGAGGPIKLTAESRVDITTPAARAVRPRVSGNNSGIEERIRRPSPRLSERLSAGFNQQQLESRQESEAARQKAEEGDTSIISARLSYLERKIKQQSAEITKLKKSKLIDE